MENKESKRNTVQRRLILNAVRELNIHATAEQVFDYVVQNHPSISKATVYRNLSQMTESGKLLNIGNIHGSAHYDHKCHKHCHFICEDCKRIFDIESDFSDIAGRIETTDEFDVADYHISFSGLCRNCKIKQNI